MMPFSLERPARRSPLLPWYLNLVGIDGIRRRLIVDEPSAAYELRRRIVAKRLPFVEGRPAVLAMFEHGNREEAD